MSYEQISKRATPRPWYCDINGNYSASSPGSISNYYLVRTTSEQTDWIADCGFPHDPMREANAALIVHCVNHYDALKASHDELVEALEKAESAGDFEQVLGAYRAVRRAALDRERAVK